MTTNTVDGSSPNKKNEPSSQEVDFFTARPESIMRHSCKTWMLVVHAEITDWIDWFEPVKQLI